MKDYNLFNSYSFLKNYLDLDYSNLGNKNRLYPVTKSISGNLGYD